MGGGPVTLIGGGGGGADCGAAGVGARLPGWSIPLDLPPVERVGRAYRRIAEVDRPEVWITLRPEPDVLADAMALQRRLDEGETLTLAGLLVAVKDNIDVAGLPTTAACPEFARIPDRTATAVTRLVDAGAVVLGKTNLDQFATGLVGTRSPYGAVRCSWDPALISGGSSSGSAVAVALGVADLGIGTDTAGSGRVPAAFNGLVGIKASLGLVPTTGVVPACVDYDCVTVLARELPLARRGMRTMIGPDPDDPRRRGWPADVLLSGPEHPAVAVPRDANLLELDPSYRTALAATVQRLAGAGVRIGTVDISGMLDAARLLYDGAIVAERYVAVGGFLEGRPSGADPTVAAIVAGAKAVPAHAFVNERQQLLAARDAAERTLSGYDALLLPTTTEHPTLAAVAADPVGINRRLGTYTNFCNLLDMAAVAVPGVPTQSGAPFGVMVVVPALHDQVALDVAALVTGDARPEQPWAEPVVTGGVPLAVFGAHLRGEPLHHQLTGVGSRFVGDVATSDAYRLLALDTTPAKPGVVRSGTGSGAEIRGELYLVPPAGLGRLLAELPAPMSLTSVELTGGDWVVGFGCSQEAADAGVDITDTGGWRTHLGRLQR